MFVRKYDKKALFLLPGGIGDLIRATACVRTYKKKYPNTNISWLVYDFFKDLLNTQPYIDFVYGFPSNVSINDIIFKKLIIFLKQKNYDDVFCLQWANPMPQLLTDVYVELKNDTMCYKINNQIDLWNQFDLWSGLSNKKSSLTLSKIYENYKHKHTSNLYNLYFKNIGYMITNNENTDRILNNINNFILFILGASSLNKRWPLEYYYDVIQKLSKHNIPIVLIGLKCETNNDSIFHKLKSLSNVYNFVDKLSLVDIGGVISKASLVVGGDTGFTNISRMLHIPTIILYGPTKDVVHIGQIHNVHSIKQNVCQPNCWQPKNDVTTNCKYCINTIEPNIVYSSIMTYMIKKRKYL